MPVKPVGLVRFNRAMSAPTIREDGEGVAEAEGASQVQLKRVAKRRSSHVEHVAQWARERRNSIQLRGDERAADGTLDSKQTDLKTDISSPLPVLSPTNSKGSASADPVLHWTNREVGRNLVLSRGKGSISDNTIFSKQFDRECRSWLED